MLTAYPKTAAVAAAGAADRPGGRCDRRAAARLDTPLLFPAAEGGYIGLDNWRTREWYPALDAAGIDRRGPYHLRHTFATEALAAGSRSSSWPGSWAPRVTMIDRTYGHLARDSEDAIRARLDGHWANATLTGGYEHNHDRDRDTTRMDEPANRPSGR